MSSSSSMDHYKSQQYQSYGSIDEYELVEGTFVLPVASLPPTDPAELANWSPVEVVQAHAPFRRKRVHFAGKKSGGPPVLPKPASVGANVFLGGTLAFPTPQTDASLTGYSWEGKGSYEFVEDCRSDPSDGFLLTGLPWTTSIQADHQFQGQGAVPQFGAVAEAGSDAQAGYAQGQQVNLAGPAYRYSVASFFPGVFFDSNVLNGVIETAAAVTPTPLQSRRLLPGDGSSSVPI